jgi:hypothetical protein
VSRGRGEIPRSDGDLPILDCRRSAPMGHRPCRARSQRRIRIAISSSRPMSGGRWRCPAWRPPPLARTSRNSITGSDTPFNLLTVGVALHRRPPPVYAAYAPFIAIGTSARCPMTARPTAGSMPLGWSAPATPRGRRLASAKPQQAGDVDPSLGGAALSFCRRISYWSAPSRASQGPNSLRITSQVLPAAVSFSQNLSSGARSSSAMAMM